MADQEFSKFVIEWLQNNTQPSLFHISNVVITPSNKVNYNGTLRLNSKVSEYPFKFGIINGSFIHSYSDIPSFVNFPTTVTGTLTISGNEKLESFEHLNVNVGGTLHMTGLTGLVDFSNIENHIQSVTDIICSDIGTKINILGITQIKNIQHLNRSYDSVLQGYINEIILNDSEKDFDLIKHQDKMIKAGYDKQASF